MAGGAVTESITITQSETELATDTSSFLFAFVVSLKAASRWCNRSSRIHATVDLFPVDGLGKVTQYGHKMNITI